MIISHRHQFIFTAIPKTGTHSVRRALREHLGPEDVEQVGLFVQKRMPYADIAKLEHGHISLGQIRPVLGESFASYFKFAFVRNPYDRFVSYCAFMTREDSAFERDPKGVMRFFLNEQPLDHLLFQPQHTFVTDEKGALLTDAVGRVETMQASYDKISAKLGFAASPLEKVNGSRHAGYRAYYDNGLIDAVGALYRRDLDLFGYTFDGAAEETAQ